jgi:hypothetical protein
MPTYVYEILDKKGQGTGKTFELVQSMRDAALTRHPETGEPVKRVIQPPNIAGNWSPLKNKEKLSNKNLQRLGFTKYEKKGKDYMERVAGKKGPRSISSGE